MRPLAIVGARFLDGRSAEPLAGDTLVVDAEGRIARIGAGRSLVPDDAEVVDAAGGTVIPGLIDCHVHLAGMQIPLHDWVQLSNTEVVGHVLRAGGRLLRAGVTTARDAGGATAGVRRLFASGAFSGPRLQVSVSPLSVTGGHGDGWTPIGADIMGALPPDLPSGVADGIDGVRRAARLQVRAGADWLKVMASGGVMSPTDAADTTQFSPGELEAIVEEATLAGLRGVMAHAHGTSAIKQALRAGVRSVEHGTLLDDEAIEIMLDRNVPLVPTFLVRAETIRPEDIASGVTPPWAVEKARRLASRWSAAFAQALERGVRVAMGSDTGGDSHQPEELALMVEHGMAPHAALRAATVEAAQLLGIDHEAGTLEPGKVADLVLLDFDPLDEPARWREPERIQLVVQGGRIVAHRRAPDSTRAS